MVAFTFPFSATGNIPVTDGTTTVNVSTTTNNGQNIFNDADVSFRGNNHSGVAVPSAEIVSMNFSAPVGNVSFAIRDIDQGGGWDDQVRVIAEDAWGNPVPITFSTSASVTVDQNGSSGTFVAEGSSNNNADIFINIAGPVSRIVVYYEDGAQNANSGAIGVGNFDIGNLSPPTICFARGTLIQTDAGSVPVETLREGDRVLTLDQGLQPIRWIGSRSMDAIDLRLNPRLKPVRIKQGALGQNAPDRDLLVSPQHRVLVRSKIAQKLFDTHEILVPACKLTDLDGIDILEDVQSIDYFHILFDSHQIIFSNGALTESLFTGPEALRAVSAKSKQEILALFPEMADETRERSPARPVVQRRKEIRKLTDRHKRNRKYLTAPQADSSFAQFL